MLVAVVFALTALGPRARSLDAVRGIDAAGPTWAAAQMAAGTLGAWGALLLGRLAGGRSRSSRVAAPHGA